MEEAILFIESAVLALGDPSIHLVTLLHAVHKLCLKIKQSFRAFFVLDRSRSTLVYVLSTFSSDDH